MKPMKQIYSKAGVALLSNGHENEKVATRIRFFYLRDYEKNRHVCIARKVDLANRLVTFAYSMNSPEDSFVKAVGRHISSERLNKDSSRFTIEFPGAMRPIEAIMAFFKYSKDERLPRSLVKLAQQEDEPIDLFLEMSYHLNNLSKPMSSKPTRDW